MVDDLNLNLKNSICYFVLFLNLKIIFICPKAGSDSSHIKNYLFMSVNFVFIFSSVKINSYNFAISIQFKDKQARPNGLFLFKPNGCKVPSL